MPDHVAQFLSRMHAARELSQLYTDVEALARAGASAQLAAIAVALEQRADLDVEAWAREAMFDHVLRCLALTPSTDHSLAVFDLVALERARTRQRPRPKDSEIRAAAALLAQGQPAETCAVVAAARSSDPVQRELLACWMQELVVRGHDLENVAPLAALSNELRDAGHPLAWLPLTRLPCESGLAAMTSVANLRGAGAALPFGPRDRMTKWTAPAPPLDVRDVEASTDVTAAVANWVEESNGKIEYRGFVIAPATTVTASILRALGLECLRGASALWLERVDTARTLQVLFSAAANGGAYNSGRRSAYGRLDAWRSLAALAGVAGATRCNDIVAATASVELFELGADGDWFYQVAWDLGLASLNGDRLIVLAATDTD